MPRALPFLAPTRPAAPPADPDAPAVLDAEHVGDIRGALGTISRTDLGPRPALSAKLKTLLAIVGPGLIVMVGDNDAGAFGTYGQAGQSFGTHLLWTLLLLVPVLYVNQEMVLRLGSVTGVGHARLILERFGKLWGAFSVIDLFLLNALTIVTEFIGVTLATGYLGLPKVPSVVLAGVVVVAAASTGSFRRFERLCLTLVAGSALLVPIYLLVHPATGTMARDLVVPGLPHGQLSTVMLLMIAIVGTTVAPWQLFFQQSYVIDKRITPRFMRYERVDLWLGIAVAVLGAAAIIGFSSAAVAGRSVPFTSAAGVAAALGRHAGRVVGDLFAVALLDASIIGACAVSLSTAYATADVLGVNHSLHRPVTKAKGFYLCYAGLVGVAAAIVLLPGAPLGLLTEGVQTLAGVLLPSATVFLLLLCNDKAVLGPWVNSPRLNVFTAVVVWVLVLLSVVLTASVLFPSIGGPAIVAILGAGVVAGAVLGGVVLARVRRAPVGVVDVVADVTPERRASWRMPVLSRLEKPVLTAQRKAGLLALRVYLLVAFALVVVKVVEVAVR